MNLDKRHGVIFILMWLAGVILVLIMVCSCNSVKQSQRLYDRAKSKSYVTVAENTRKDFPCIANAIDTVFSTDTLQGLDSIIVEQDRIVTIYDTIQGRAVVITHSVRVPCACPPERVVVKTRTITKQIEDSAKIVVAQDRESKAVKELVKHQNGKRTWRIIAFVFIALFGISSLLKYVFKV